MQLEPPSCRAAGWAGPLLPRLCMFPESLLLPRLVSGDPRDAQDQGPEGMLSKPYPREMGKFSTRRPALAVVSVSTSQQAGPGGVGLSVLLSVSSLPSAMLALSLGMRLQTLPEGLTTPASPDWPDLGLVFQLPSSVRSLIS